MSRVLIVSSLLVVALTACDPSTDVPVGATCETGQVVCGDDCCTADEQCNTATATCEPKCAPSCRNRECGPDGCGGVCGTCQGGFNCQDETGICYACQPSCDGKDCGSDGCGGSCGNCPTGTTCQGGTCGACQPQCNGKQCGPDGCGGQCGTCPGGACDPSGKCVECLGDGDCASSANGKKCSPDRRCVACLTNQDCKADGSIACDTSTNRCQVGCTSDGDCSGTPGAPRCDTQQSKCVACLGSGDCGGLTPSCDPGTRTCVACASDSECVSRGAGNRCLDKQECVECLSNGDCGGGTCNLTTHKCGECTIDADCSGNPTKKLCDSASRTCVACRSDGQCGGSTPSCDTATGTCVVCATDAQCVARGEGARCLNKQQCVQCLSATDCGGSTPACHGTSRTCVECTGDANCSGKPGRTRCQLGTSTCVQCLSNTDCAGGTCQGGQCVGSTAGGDTCTAPGVINLGSGTATISGDLSGANHDISGTCGGSGRDVVYTFTLASTKDLTVSVTAVTSGMQPVVYLSSTCSGTGEVACDASGSATSTITRQGLAAGTYYLWVDSTAGFPQGQFTLTVTAAEPPPPSPGDTCGIAIPLTFNAQGNATVTGSLAGAKADYTSLACTSSTGPDVVYRFTTPYAGPFSASVISHASSFRPTLALWSQCPATLSGHEPRCDTATSAGGFAALTYQFLPAGTWYLVVDSATAASGDFDLQVSIPTTPPPTGGEHCNEPTPLTFVNGTATASGSTVGRVHDQTATTCSPNSSPDVVYTFSNPVAQNVMVTLKNKTAGFKPTISLQSGTCGSSQLGCQYNSNAGGNLQRVFENVPAGAAYLWVDSYTGTPSGGSPTPATTGSYDLAVHLGVPNAGTGAESCSSVASRPITLIDGFAFGRGTLTGLHTDDSVSSCYSGGDVVYRLDVPPGKSKLTVYAAFDASLNSIAVQVTRGASCATSTSVGCDVGWLFSPSSEVVVNSPVADTYYVWIAGAGSNDYGSYYFDVILQ